VPRKWVKPLKCSAPFWPGRVESESEFELSWLLTKSFSYVSCSEVFAQPNRNCRRVAIVVAVAVVVVVVLLLLLFLNALKWARIKVKLPAIKTEKVNNTRPQKIHLSIPHTHSHTLKHTNNNLPSDSDTLTVSAWHLVAFTHVPQFYLGFMRSMLPRLVLTCNRCKNRYKIKDKHKQRLRVKLWQQK